MCSVQFYLVYGLRIFCDFGVSLLHLISWRCGTCYHIFHLSTCFALVLKVFLAEWSLMSCEWICIVLAAAQQSVRLIMFLVFFSAVGFSWSSVFRCELDALSS